MCGRTSLSLDYLTANGAWYGRPNGTPLITVCTGLRKGAAVPLIVTRVKERHRSFDQLHDRDIARRTKRRRVN